MKVKMTRTERAIHKAQKAALAAYKLGKAPTLYEAVNGGYVIDSVESRQSLDVEKLTALVKSWVSAVRPNHKLYISDCSYGITQKVIATLRKGFSLLAEEEPAPAFKPEGHYEYRDSKYGVFSIN